MEFSAYKVAVKLSLVSNVAAGLSALSGQFAKLNKDVTGVRGSITELERSLVNIKRMGLVGGAMAGAGFGALSLFKAPLEEAKEFQTEISRFAALGLGDKTNEEAVKFAKGMDVMGQSARDNMKLLREATGIMGDFEHAKEVVPILAQMKFGLESVMGEGKGADFERMFQSAIKVTELRGALVNRETGQIDTAKFKATLDMMTQAYVASGGMVKPQDYLQAIKTGGVSAKMMNDEMFMFGLGHFMQESGGSRTGTAAMSMFQNWAMGRMPQRVAERMADLGLLDQKAIHYGKTGHITGVDPMGIIRANEFAANPFKYVNEVVVPMLQKKGYTGNDLNMQLASLFGIRTASNLADQFVREQKVADLYVQRAQKASGITGLYQEGGKNLQGNILEMEAKWRDVLRELGTTVLPVAIKAVEGLTAIFKSVIKFGETFPLVTRGIVAAVGILAVAAAAGGAIMLAKAGIQALTVALALNSGLGGTAALAATRIGVLTTALKGMLVLAAAWEAGQFVGSKIYDSLPQENKDKLGRNIAGILAFFGNKEAKEAIAGEDKYIRSQQQASQSKTGHIYMDGRKVGEIVSGHQARAASMPTGGTTSFDGAMQPRPVGANGSW